MRQLFFWGGLISTGFITCMLYLAARSLGEFDVAMALEKQHRSPSSILYNSGINQDFYSYKLELLDKINPTVVALGSSRAMQVREKFFTRDFANLGGGVYGPLDFSSVVIELEKRANTVDLALVFVDPWWFLDDIGGRQSAMNNFSGGLSVEALLVMLDFFIKSSWSFDDYDFDNLGLAAIANGAGFAVDGSYVYSLSLKDEFDVLSRFEDDYVSIANGSGYFKKAESISSKLVAQFCDSALRLSGAIKNVVLVYPPFAPSIYEEISRDPGYQYMDTAFERVADCVNGHAQVVWSLRGVKDREFIDGFHGGDVAYARILLELSSAKETSSVAKYIDHDYLNQYIFDNAGEISGIWKGD